MPILIEECNLLMDENIIDTRLSLCKNDTLPVTLPVTLSELVSMEENRRSTTIFDVAAAAGVSVSTVSRVLNNKDDVSELTYQRVSKVIDDLGYSSSLAARSMRSRKTNVVGLIMPDVGDPFSVEIMRGINQAIVELGYDLLIYTNGDIRSNTSALREQQYVALLNNSVTDGVIIVAPAARSFQSVSPVVSIDPNIDSPSGPAVISTNYKGAREATEHLIALGHRRIGFIGGRTDLLSAHRRREGYETALQDAGIPVEPTLMLPGDYTSSTASEQSHQLLSLDDPPTAIFAANDQSAMGVLNTAEIEGVSIPDDLSVIGFDNIPESLFHGISTIDQFMEQMGYQATRLLIDLIRGIEPENPIIKIETRLIARKSTKALGDP